MTRHGVWLAGGRPHLLPLGPVEPGRIDLWFAAAPDEPADVRVRRVGVGWPVEPPACELRWDATQDDSWQVCTLEVESRVAEASIEVAVENADRRIFAAAPITRVRGASAAPPIFVVMVDTLRADRIALEGDTLRIGGAMARLSRDGVHFEKARSTSSWTRTAVASLLTGLGPRRHRVLDRLDVLADELLTLPEVLQGNGYRTVGWSTNANVLATWGFAQGFDEFTDVATARRARMKTDAAVVLDRVRAEVLRFGTAPVFYYVHLMDPHHPYQPPGALLEAVRSDEALADTYPGPADSPNRRNARVYQRYVAEIADLDAKLGDFLDFLREKGVYEASVVLLVADHGEEFLDHGGTFHGRTLFEEVVRVPAILKLPDGRRAGTRIAQRVDLGDMMPTLLDAAGLEQPDGLEGRSPLDGVPRRTTRIAELKLDGRHQGAVLDGSWKLVIDYHAPGAGRLFDLETDPGERRNLFSARPGKVQALRRLLDEKLAATEGGWHVRGCGAREPELLDLQLSVSGAAPRAMSFEPEDRLEGTEPPGSPGRFDVHMDLSPRTGIDTLSDPPVETLVPDVDEIVIPEVPGGDRVALTLTRTDGGNQVVLLAGLPEWIRADVVELGDRDRAAAVPAGRVMDCVAPEEAQGAYLMIWRVLPGGLSRQPDEIDGELRERLRALGYDW